MDLMEEKIKELEKQIAELKAQLKEKKENSKWIPEENERYYFMDVDLSVRDYSNTNYVDKKIIKYNKVFPTIDQAERYSDYLKARHECSYEFSREEWENSKILKYYIFYKFGTKKIDFSYVWHTKGTNEIYFDSKEEVQEFINKYKKEILEFEFGIVEE